MAVPDRSAALRALPSVEEVLQRDAARAWLAALPRARVADLVRDAISARRELLVAGADGAASDSVASIESSVDRAVASFGRSSLRPVINASGVILHTNLGRAPLSSEAVRAVAETAGRYSNVEYDIEEGVRGGRDAHCGALLASLLGAPAIVVNNNAAAVFLAVHELARGGEVIVSRGELVEIGDGFRIPDILEATQATLREVGATNRTALDDYRRAINPRTKAVLRIHPSNFRQIGFTGKPALADLAELARSASLPLIEDLGSGSLTDLAEQGIQGEPWVLDSLRAGADIVTFSGDKLLGGPQAGIIAGDPDLVKRIRRNPLFRAFRVDKLALAALSATLRSHIAGREVELPAVRFMRAPVAEVARRARRLAERLVELGMPHAEPVPGQSLLGGGSTPMQPLPSTLVAVAPPKGTSASEFESRLRSSNPPVVARIEKDRLLFDLRTVFEDEEDALVSAIVQAADLRGRGQAG